MTRQRIIAAVVGSFVVVVVGLWIRHHRAEERHKELLAEYVADARRDDAQRIAALKKFFNGNRGPMAQRRCGVMERSTIVRLPKQSDQSSASSENPRGEGGREAAG